MTSHLSDGSPIPTISSTPLQNLLPKPVAPKHPRLIHYLNRCLYFFIFITIIVFILGFLIATEKIEIPYQNLQTKIASLIFKIPFIPKTSKYLLTTSWLAHQQSGSFSYDVTVSAASKQLKDIIGTSEIGINIVGYTDINDKNNPNYFFTANADKYLSSDVKKINNNIFVKVNKISKTYNPTLDYYLDFLPDSSSNWNSIDSTNIDPSTFNIVVSQLNSELFNDNIFSSVQQKQENYINDFAYRLVYTPTENQLKSINKILIKELKLNETQQITDLNMVAWLDSKNYLAKKILISFNLISLDEFSPVPQISIALTANLSDHGTKKNIDYPQNTVSWNK